MIFGLKMLEVLIAVLLMFSNSIEIFEKEVSIEWGALVKIIIG